MIKYTIFVVDDDPGVREVLSMALASHYQLETFGTAEAAIEAVRQQRPDLVLLDIRLPGMDGLEALGQLREIAPDLLVIMVTGVEDIKTVVKAMRLGAHDYVVKPVHLEALGVRIRNALQSLRLRKEVQLLQERYLQENLPCFIGESQAIQTVMDMVHRVAQSPDTPVLIVGETGTGKELIALAIHYHSPNFAGPLITVNCASIPRDLIESELFGYEPGAFSGARPGGKKGLLEEAADGTLFLDEVGDLSREAQAKLLRFLEEGEYYRVGGTRKLHLQTRVISATNKDLEKLIRQEKFREDLYFRLGVIKLQIPSLNERRQDVLPLSRHFLAEFSNKFGKQFTGISPAAAEFLEKRPWPGNIRELKNLIEKGVLLGKGPELTLEDLGTTESLTPLPKTQDGWEVPPLPARGLDLNHLLASIEKSYLEEAIKIAKGNECRAARLLGLNHHTFRYRYKKLKNK